MMKVCKDNELCTGCEACVNLCARNAITMQPDWRGFLYPRVDEEKCVNCGLCIKQCPANKQKEPFVFPPTIAFVENDREKLLAASSGGAFGVLARYVLSKNGVVFGVEMNDEYDVFFTSVDDVADLHKLHGSKYVQPNVGLIYRSVKDFLVSGKDVLFCGCPCHVAGLKSFLGRQYDNLITMDLICHGVPSQRYFKDYVYDKLSKQNGITKFLFRYKGDDANIHVGYSTKDYYMTYFLWGKGCRDSCYKCLYAGGVRPADFTIGDYWNNKNNKVLTSDANGASLVLFNTGKAGHYKYLFEQSGECANIGSLESAISKDGGNLAHPSRYDVRCKLIYVLYRMFGVKGPKLLFWIERKRMGI